jgi:hypothetical protein
MKLSEIISGQNRAAKVLLQGLPIREKAATLKEIEAWPGTSTVETLPLEQAAQILMDAGLPAGSHPLRGDRLVVETRGSTHLLTRLCFRLAPGEFLLVQRKVNLLMRKLLETGEKVNELSRRLGVDYPGGEVYELFWDSYMGWSAGVLIMLEDKPDLDWTHVPLKMHDWVLEDGKAPFPLAHPQVEEVQKRILALYALLQKYETEQ